MSKPAFTFHLIPNAHLDPVWLWDWREGLNEGLITCRTILDLMDEDRELTFIRGESFIYEHIERAEFADLREWLRENVHRHGRKFMSKELLQRVVGGSIDSGPYLKYLRAKFGEIYGL